VGKAGQRKAAAASLLEKLAEHYEVFSTGKISLYSMDRTAPVRLWDMRPMDRNVFYPIYPGADAIRAVQRPSCTVATKYRGAHGGLVYDATCYQLAGFVEFATQMLLTLAGCFVTDPLMPDMNLPLAMPFDDNAQSVLVICDACAMPLDAIVDESRAKHQSAPCKRCATHADINTAVFPCCCCHCCYTAQNASVCGDNNNGVDAYKVRLAALMRTCVLVYRVSRGENLHDLGAMTRTGPLMIVDMAHKEYAKTVTWVAPIECLPHYTCMHIPKPT
jgi:hypothetical protein